MCHYSGLTSPVARPIRQFNPREMDLAQRRKQLAASNMGFATPAGGPSSTHGRLRRTTSLMPSYDEGLKSAAVVGELVGVLEHELRAFRLPVLTKYLTEAFTLNIHAEVSETQTGGNSR